MKYANLSFFLRYTVIVVWFAAFTATVHGVNGFLVFPECAQAGYSDYEVKAGTPTAPSWRTAPAQSSY
jgi:hypothetical protein